MAKTNDIMAQLGIEFSETASNPHCKLMFWGPTGSRKTETVLRFFPHVLVADTEGNTDQCVRNPEIPPFLRVKTKDARKVLEALDAAAEGKLKFPDGSPVETFCIDSGSVLWGVQQEVAASLAEKRAAKYNRSIDEATMTQIDWVIAKRPVKRILTRFNNSPIRFLVLIARQKDLYEEDGGNNPKKIGLTFDMVKGVDYEMNVALKFGFEGQKWFYEVTKVQGNLKTIFPMGKKGHEFPTEKLMAYTAEQGEVKVEHREEMEEDLARSIAETENENAEPKTSKYLVQIAKEQWGLSAAEVGNALKDRGITEFMPSRWMEMKQIVLEYAASKVA